MTRARAKALQHEVNSLLSTCDFNTPLDDMLLHSDMLWCVIRYQPQRLHPLGQGTNTKERKRWAESSKVTRDGTTARRSSLAWKSYKIGTTSAPTPVLPLALQDRYYWPTTGLLPDGAPELSVTRQTKTGTGPGTTATWASTTASDVAFGLWPV
jgi:hypothetical protein